jgi:hypothetical protein
MWTRRTQRNEAAPARFPLPQEATAFSVLALLRLRKLEPAMVFR